MIEPFGLAGRRMEPSGDVRQKLETVLVGLVWEDGSMLYRFERNEDVSRILRALMH